VALAFNDITIMPLQICTPKEASLAGNQRICKRDILEVVLFLATENAEKMQWAVNICDPQNLYTEILTLKGIRKRESQERDLCPDKTFERFLPSFSNSGKSWH
jgi:hypothetical protein